MPTTEWVRKEALAALAALGFGSYEAKAYCALLRSSPANGYQVAQNSGIPRAKIYECLQRLEERGAVVQLERSGRQPRRFVPTDPKAMFEALESRYCGVLTRAGRALERIGTASRVAEVLWRVNSPADLIERGRALASSAGRTLHVAIWSEEFEALLPALVSAVERGVRTALVLYDPHPAMDRFQQRCPGAVLHSRTKRQAVPVMGRQFVLVADGERCITGSIFSHQVVEGVYTLNIGLVTNAVDLVNHEIYLERVMLALEEPLAQAFGPDLERLDPFAPP